MADKVTKMCMDLYRKLEKSRFLNIIERLQIPNILEIFTMKICPKIYINPCIDFFYFDGLKKSRSRLSRH
jgi:hypothetical protein